MAEETKPEQPEKKEDLDIQRLVEEDKQRRSSLCEKEINDILKKYNCSLSTLQVFINGRPGDIQVRVDPK